MRYVRRMGYIDLTVKLPEDLARDAEASGLLSSAKLEQMIRAEIKRKAAYELGPRVDEDYGGTGRSVHQPFLDERRSTCVTAT